MYTSLPPPSPVAPLSVITEPQFEFFESYSKFPLAVYLHMLVHMHHAALSIHLTLSLFSPALCKSLHLHCCSENRFISTILLDPIYMHYSMDL